MKCKIFAVVALTSALCLTGMCANALEFTATPNFTDSTVTISGTSEKNDMLSVLITKGEVGPTDLEGLITDKTTETHSFTHTGGGTSSVSVNVGSIGSELAYADIVTANENGTFEIELTLGKTDKHNVYVTSTSKGETKSDSFDFVSYTEYETAVGLLNVEIEENDKEGFKKVLSDNKTALGFKSEADAYTDIEMVGTILFNSLDGKMLDKALFDENISLYEKCVIAAALNASKLDNVVTYLYEDIKGNELYSQYKKFIEDSKYKESYEKYLTTKMSGKGIKTVEELINVYEDGLILTAVRYPDGYMNIKDLFSVCKEKEKLSITSVSTKSSVYSNLAGEYESIDALEKKYDDLGGNNSNGSDSNSDGTGNLGGNSGSNIKYGAVNDEKTDVLSATVKMPFTDLDTTMWAYEAISTLVNKGIVNGRTETEFVPRDTVKREEFVKMIVCAVYCEPGDAENIFADVKTDDWFAPYVNYANKAGLVSGVGESRFGVGDNITRQDMAVIIHNALKSKGVKLSAGESMFTDSANIADYAKDAVAVLAGAKVVNGNADGTFNPNGNATRAEAAQIIFNMLGALK